jgi:uncharacterized membrane protein
VVDIGAGSIDVPDRQGERVTIGGRFRGRRRGVAAWPGAALGPTVAVWTLLFVWALVMYRLGALRHDRFSTFGFDLGIYDQAGWLVARGADPFMTVRGLNVWGHHGTFVFYLLAPGYWFGGGPQWLLFAQVTSQVSAALALYLLVRDTMGRDRRWFGVAAASVLLLNPTHQFLVWEFFHPEAFALGPLLLAWWALRTQRWVWFGAFAFVAATCKEDIVLAVAMMGIVIAISQPRTQRTIRIGIGTTVVAIGWYLLVTKWLIPAHNPFGSFYEQQFFTDFGTSTGAVLIDVLAHPMHALRFFTETQRVAPGARTPDTGHLDWYRMMLVPALGIGLLRPKVWLVAVPAIGVALLTDEGHNWVRDYHYHYSAVVAAVSVLAAIETVIWLHARVGARGDALRFVPHAAMSALVISGLYATRRWGAFPEPLSTRLAVAAGLTVLAVGVTVGARTLAPRFGASRPTTAAAAVIVSVVLTITGAFVVSGHIAGSWLDVRNPGSRGTGWWPYLAGESFWDLAAGVDPLDDPRSAIRQRAVDLIPADASVSAAYNMTPHLSSRRFAYQFPNPWVPENWGVQNEAQHDPGTVDYLLVDRSLIDDDTVMAIVEHLLASEFEAVIDDDDIVLAHRIAPPECIDDAAGLIRRRINDQRYDTNAPPSTGKVCPVT